MPTIRSLSAILSGTVCQDHAFALLIRKSKKKKTTAAKKTMNDEEDFSDTLVQIGVYFLSGIISICGIWKLVEIFFALYM